MARLDDWQKILYHGTGSDAIWIDDAVVFHYKGIFFSIRQDGPITITAKELGHDHPFDKQSVDSLDDVIDFVAKTLNDPDLISDLRKDVQYHQDYQPPKTVSEFNERKKALDDFLGIRSKLLWRHVIDETGEEKYLVDVSLHESILGDGKLTISQVYFNNDEVVEEQTVYVPPDAVKGLAAALQKVADELG